jgi:outer membrane beta-barrel protein
VVIPSVGFTIADAYARNMLVGLGYNYHFLNWLSAGVDYSYGVGVKTDLADQIEGELSAPGKAFDMNATSIRMLAGANIGLVPIQGKFVLMDRYGVWFDCHLVGGAGYAWLRGGDKIPATSTFAPYFGAGARVFILKWMAVLVEFRDVVIKRREAVLKDNVVPGEEWGQNFVLGAGVSFLLPTEVTFGE